MPERDRKAEWEDYLGAHLVKLKAEKASAETKAVGQITNPKPAAPAAAKAE